MTTKSNRHRVVDAKCEWCGIIFPARKDRIDKGQSRWCSRPHYLEWLTAQGTQKKNVGKENALIVWDKSKDAYCAYWYDSEMKYHSTTWARWYWELNVGEIPSKYYATYKDGNSKNNTPENVCLKTMNEISDIGDRNRGVPMLEETKKKLSKAHTGKTLSETHKLNIGKAVADMWKRGVFDSPKTRAVYSKQGSATKGSKRTEEQKRRMSESKIGKKQNYIRTPEHVAKIVAKLIGRKASDEEKKKISDAMKGRVITEKHRVNLSKALKGKYTGEDASGYKDGKSIPEYPSDFGAYTKSAIRRRDGNICQSCHIDVSGIRRGHIHHIDNDKFNSADDNMILLCVPCHQSVHGKNTIETEMISYLKTRLTR